MTSSRYRSLLNINMKIVKEQLNNLNIKDMAEFNQDYIDIIQSLHSYYEVKRKACFEKYLSVSNDNSNILDCLHFLGFVT